MLAELKPKITCLTGEWDFYSIKSALPASQSQQSKTLINRVVHCALKSSEVFFFWRSGEYVAIHKNHSFEPSTEQNYAENFCKNAKIKD